MRAMELEERLRQRDWAALEQLSRLWQQGAIPADRTLEILTLILPASAESPAPTAAPIFHGLCLVRW